MARPRIHPRPPARKDDDRHAFLTEETRSSDDLAEALAESFVASATSGEETGEEVHEQHVTEEEGGPFVVTGGPSELPEDLTPLPPAPRPAPLPRSRPAPRSAAKGR